MMFVDFLKEIEVKRENLLRGFKDVEIDKTILRKNSSTLVIYLKSDNIISYKRISKIQKEIESKLKPSVKKVNILVKVSGLEKKSSTYVIKKYWNNIEYFIKTKCPSLNAYEQSMEHLCMDECLKIKANNDFIYDRLKDKDIETSIKELILFETGLDLEVKLEKARSSKKEVKETEILKIMDEQEKEIKNIMLRMENAVETGEKKDGEVGKKDSSKLKTVEVIDKSSNDSKNSKKEVKDKNKKEDKEDRYGSNRELDPRVFYGANVMADYIDIEKIDEYTKTVSIEGTVFETEEKELRNGKTLYSIYITDNTSAICAKVYLNDLNKEKVQNKCKKGSYVRLKGDIKLSNYTGDIEMNITGMRDAEKPVKKDEAKEKRVELHLHTQMSSMDSVVPVKKVINIAESWGHKAIAITDHGVVQAFPDAMNESSKKNIKVLYGVEAYLVDDSQDIVLDANDKDFNQKFVVFDLETTGFSPVYDNITEIGAVLVENGVITDEFSTFVDPEMDISFEVVSVTGITNEMVEGAPKIEDALRDFMEFCKDAVLVAHNADFDTGFISQKCSEVGLEYNHNKVDTLMLSRVLLPHLKKFSLDKICKEVDVKLTGHHRAVNDAMATAEVFVKFIERFKKDGANVLSDINKIYGKVDYTKIRPTHATVLAKNQEGLKDLYKLISDSHIEHFYRNPLILKSLLKEKKENLLIGTACSSGELYSAVMRNKPKEEISKLLELYDFVEVMPIGNNEYLVKNGELKDKYELQEINKRIIEIGEEFNKIVVATGDVHTLEPHEYIYRDILKFSQGFGKLDSNKSLYFRTTDEMLSEFDYLDKDKAYEIVVTNTNKIADMIDDILPIPKETYPPVIEGSKEELRRMCFEKAERIYGNPLPKIVEDRLNKELNSIIGNGYAVMYIIANKLVAKSLSDGYLVGSRGSVGSSFAATMSDITEVNPLPAHYICPNPECKHSHFFGIGEWGSGVDLPPKKCDKCGTDMIRDGHDIPFEVFLGFEGDKEPDIDLNFSGVYQPTIHKYTEELFGEGYTYRAGTIGTVKDKTAFGYVKKFSDDNELDYSQAEMRWLTSGCTGVKKTSGQHPGGVMVIPHYKDVHDFTPIQYPANDPSSGVKTTHFDYHSISGRILKLDILGHDGPTIIRMLEDMTGIKITDIPLDDKETMSLFTSTKALGVTEEEINSPVGSLAIPEFGTKFTRQMLVDTMPTTFAELVRIAGLSHGTDVWVNNAQDLVRGNVVGLKEVISTRDDIMNYLIFSKLEPKMAFTIMESVRKGKGLKPEFEAAMRENNVPEWYINSCKKIKYMFPKAHAVAYVMTSFRIAYCKVHYPEAFYATYFTTKVEDFDIELITSGIDNVKKRMEEIQSLGTKATAKEHNQYTILEVVVEMYARKIEFLKVDIYKSHASEFQIAGKGKILPPMISLQGMGQNAAESVVEARKDGEFISKEDLLKRTKLSKTVVDKLTDHGSLEDMSDKNQLSFF